MSADALNYWLGMTCLYDPYHTPNDDKITLPVCMFHVKKIVPTRTVETSKKRVILYEPQNDDTKTAEQASKPLRSGVMQTIVDNAVKQPVTYNMEIIVPFQPVGRYFTAGLRHLQDVVTGFEELLGGKGGVQGYFSSAMFVSHVAKQIADAAGRLSGMDGASYINMNSLEAMADSCRTLCMKMWTGMEYKYVMITGMTPDKQPAEDDVFRVALTLQEMPVLEVFHPSAKSINTVKRNPAAAAVSAVQSAMVTPLYLMTGVGEASDAGLAEGAASMFNNL
jgi:hypothetical protein